MQLYNLNKKQSSGCSSGGVEGSSRSSGGGNDQGKEIDGHVERNSPEVGSRQRSGKGVLFFRFNGARRNLLLLQRRWKNKKKRKKESLVNSRVSGGCGGGLCCCFCIKQPMTLDSSIESPTSDPNSKEFTYDMMRVLIEKNDFYAKECNPHLDDK